MPAIVSRDEVNIAGESTPLVQIQKTDAEGTVQGTPEQIYAYKANSDDTAGTTEKTQTQNTTIASTLGVKVLDASAGEKAYNEDKKEEAEEKAAVNAGNAVVLEENPDATCRIGTVAYEAFDEAIKACKDGETITLITDVEVTSEYNLNTNMLGLSANNSTLDLNGHKITIYNNFTFAIAANNVTVKNGTIASRNLISEASAGSDWRTMGYHSFALVIGAKNLNDSVSNITLKNLTTIGGVSFGGSADNNDANYQGTALNCKIYDCTFNAGNSAAIYAQLNSSVTVYSGTYKINSNIYNIEDYNSGSGTKVFNAESGSTIAVVGGTFEADPTSYTDTTQYTVTDNGNGTWTVK